jgi:hypothetical protein
MPQLLKNAQKHPIQELHALPILIHGFTMKPPENVPKLATVAARQRALKPKKNARLAIATGWNNPLRTESTGVSLSNEITWLLASFFV